MESITSRYTTKYHEPAANLTDDQSQELVRFGTAPPKSFHMHNWRFIAVRTPEAKARLRPTAWDQPAITDAAVTFIVCGPLTDQSVTQRRLALVVEAGVRPADMPPPWENTTSGPYFEHPQRHRYEAARTGTFGTSAMIRCGLCAGPAFGPTIGFDAEAVAREFALAEDEVPVVLVSVGAEYPGHRTQKPLRPVAEVLGFAQLRSLVLAGCQRAPVGTAGALGPRFVFHGWSAIDAPGATADRRTLTSAPQEAARLMSAHRNVGRIDDFTGTIGFVVHDNLVQCAGRERSPS